MNVLLRANWESVQDSEAAKVPGKITATAWQGSWREGLTKGYLLSIH